MVRWSDWVVLAGVSAGALSATQVATGAVAVDADEIVEIAAPGEVLFGAADLTLRYVQEGGPDSGHVRVLLIPASRPLTILEARSAAQQAFLKALDKPGLGDRLRRVTVVVRLMPASHPDPAAAEQIISFVHKGGRDWSVLSGE